MPPHAQPKTGFDIDHATNTIRYALDFAAPADLVFEAWTQPEQVRCWWDAAGEPLAVCEIDLRPGGHFRFVSRMHPEMPFTGVYVEIAPPGRLVFEAMNSTGRVLLASADGKTRMTVEIACGSASQLEQFLKMGVAAGTSQTLDNLAAYIQRQGVAG